MNLDELKALFGRLTRGPVPTQKKKVYAYAGRAAHLLELIPGAVLVQGSVLDAFDEQHAPQAEEAMPRYMARALADHALALREGRATSVTLLADAAVLARYRVPLTQLFESVGDAHAVVLHVAEDLTVPAWPVPSYLRFEPAEIWRYFETTLPDQAIMVRRTEA